MQPSFWRWLSWALPIEIIAGIIAAAAFVVALMAQRARRSQRRLRPLPGDRLHRFAGYVLAIAAAFHVALVAGMSAAAMILVAAGLAMVAIQGLAGERHGLALALTLALAVLATAALTVGPLAESRLEPLRRAPIDHANFLHADHKGLACTGCHHNFLDRAGNENCLSCHKRASTTETMRIDRVFHAFCASCHRADRQAGKEFGPIDNCNGCHAGSRRLNP
jgi:predicted CXXCH cytochrome family protein